eukprot:365106-Chlamydomonas_euryale.AAC.3
MRTCAALRTCAHAHMRCPAYMRTCAALRTCAHAHMRCPAYMRTCAALRTCAHAHMRCPAYRSANGLVHVPFCTPECTCPAVYGSACALHRAGVPKDVKVVASGKANATATATACARAQVSLAGISVGRLLA